MKYLILVFVVCLCGCNENAVNILGMQPRIWVDYHTGCQYLIVPDASITPRLGTNGFPLCGNEVPAVEQ